MLRDDVRELRRVADQALRNGEECWPVLPDGGSDGDSETYRRIKFRVNQPSGVTQGDATFTVDNVRPICGGVNPVASTADGVNLTINDALGSYADNAEGTAEWDNDNSEWIDATDQSGDASPQTYNVQLQAAKTKAAASVSVKWLDASMVEVGSAFDAYDPHGQFSSGTGITNAKGRIAKVTDADDGSERWELTHLEGLALFAKGAIDEDEGATTSGKASDTSPTTWGPKWQETSPPGTINVVGLEDALSGDEYTAVLSDPDADPPEYEAFVVTQEIPDGVIDLVEILSDTAAKSSDTAGFTEDAGSIVAICNSANAGINPVRINGRLYDFSGSSQGDIVHPITPELVTLYNYGRSDLNAPSSGTAYWEAKKIGDGEYQIISPTQLQLLDGYDGDGTSDQVITNVDDAVGWENTGACS